MKQNSSTWSSRMEQQTYALTKAVCRAVLEVSEDRVSMRALPEKVGIGQLATPKSRSM